MQEFYDAEFGLSASERVKHHLIGRYRDKVSPRLLDERYALSEKCRGAFGGEISRLMKAPNPFLSFIKKDKPWSGAAMPVPMDAANHKPQTRDSDNAS
jgi:hypothetical protein